MAIPIDESVLLTVAGLVFIPVFGFCIKMIMETGSLKAKLESAIDLHKRDVATLQKDIERNREIQNNTNEKVEKAFEFINQFLYGTKTKSFPAYMSGENETDRHRDMPESGMFRDPESSDSQTHTKANNNNNNRKGVEDKTE